MKKILFVFLLALGFVGCDKDEPEVEGTTIEKLTGTGSKKWKLTEALAYSGTLQIDLMSREECLRDNELVLRDNFTYTLEDIGVQCSPATKIEDTWILSESPLQIKLAEIALMGRSFKDIVLDINELKANKFSGVIKSVPTNTYGVDKIELTFTEVK